MSSIAAIGGVIMMVLQLVLELMKRNPPDPEKGVKDRDARIDTAMAGSNEDVGLELHHLRERMRHEGSKQ